MPVGFFFGGGVQCVLFIFVLFCKARAYFRKMGLLCSGFRSPAYVSTDLATQKIQYFDEQVNNGRDRMSLGTYPVADKYIEYYPESKQ